MKRNLISALQDRDRLPKKQPDWRLPPEWPARRSPVIWPAAEGWRGRDCDIVAHIDQHLGPCNSYRAEVCCRTKPRSYGRPQSRLSTCGHVSPAGDRMRRAPYRSARRWWPPAAAVRLPDWRIAGYAKTV